MTWVLLVVWDVFHIAIVHINSPPPLPPFTLPVKSEIKHVISDAMPEFGTLQIYVSQEIIVLQMESFQKEMER